MRVFVEWIRSVLYLGDLLGEIYYNSMYLKWGYKNFNEYVADIGLKLRHAQYLIRDAGSGDHRR